MATALVVGNIIGAGVVMLPVSLAPYGWNSILGWLVTLVGALCLAWVYASLARHLPNAGGAVGYMQMTLGDGAAFVGAWGYWISIWVANAAIAIGGLAYLGQVVPVVAQQPLLGGAVTAAVLALLTWANARGTRTAGWVQAITTIVKLLPFAALPVLVVARLRTHGVATVLPLHAGDLSLGSATAAATLTLYSMLGLESAAIPADAVERPEVTVPRATMIGTWVAGLVSLFACSAIILLMPAAAVIASPAPLVDFVTRDWGPGAATAVALCVMISAYGCLNGWVLLAGELPAAMAQTGALPPWWGVRNRHGAPRNALLVSSALTAALIVANFSKSLSAAFTFAILLATSTILAMYLFCAVAVLVLQRRGTLPRSRGLQASAVGAILFVLWALAGAGWAANLWGVVLIAAGWPLHRLMRARAAAAAARA